MVFWKPDFPTRLTLDPSPFALVVILKQKQRLLKSCIVCYQELKEDIPRQRKKRQQFFGVAKDLDYFLWG